MMQMWRSICVISWLLLLASVLPFRLSAQAITAANGPGAYISVGGGASLYQFEYGQRKLGGITAWADINPTWRYGIETEYRSLRYRTDEGVTETTYLAGPRVDIFPGPLRPYVKFLAGAGHYDLPFNFAQGTFFTYAPGAGVDLMLNDVVSLRLMDFEYQVSTNFQASPNDPPSQLRNYGISTGINIRLTPLFRFPKMQGYRRRHYDENPR